MMLNEPLRAPVEHRIAPPLWLLVLVTMSGTLARQMFAPAPYSGEELNATGGQVQIIISMYIIGLAGGQLIYGELCYALGRRPAMLLSNFHGDRRWGSNLELYGALSRWLHYDRRVDT